MILVALGANLPSIFGSPKDTLAAAKIALKNNGFEIGKESQTWISAPVPISDQPWFHNAVIEIKTDKKPHEVLDKLLSIEQEFGRVRTVRNAARVIDLDIIDYNGEIIDDERLTLPHPRMHDRAFVVKPIMDIDPNWKHPVTGKSIEELGAELPKDQEIKPIS